MRSYIITYICLLISCVAFSQQENLVTQYAYNKASVNPGVAGENDYLTLTGVYRDQWTGLDGGPQSQLLTVNFPSVVNNRLGFGLQLQRQSIGVQERTDVTGMYAYRQKLGKGVASIGLQLSYRSMTNDFADPRLVAINGFELDPSISREKYSTSILNVGLGAYYRTPNYYFGVSVPRTIEADIDSEITESISREFRHYYAMAGVHFSLTDEWDFSPQLLYKATSASPFDVDILGLMTYRDQIHMGINFRTGGSQKSIIESLDLLLGLKLNNGLFASIAYDFTTTEIREFENGSFEILLQYSFNKISKPKEIQNPRYFR